MQVVLSKGKDSTVPFPVGREEEAEEEVALSESEDWDTLCEPIYEATLDLTDSITNSERWCDLVEDNGSGEECSGCKRSRDKQARPSKAPRLAARLSKVPRCASEHVSEHVSENPLVRVRNTVPRRPALERYATDVRRARRIVWQDDLKARVDSLFQQFALEDPPNLEARLLFNKAEELSWELAREEMLLQERSE